MQAEVGNIVEFRYDSKLTWDFFKNNIEENLKRSTPRLFDVIKRGTATGECAIVAGGPSLKDQLSFLRVFKGDIFGGGTVHDYLIENDIIPKYHVILDPDVETAGFINKPNKDITYLVSSQCHKNTFEALKDQKVLLWHSFVTIDEDPYIRLSNEGTPISDFNGEESVRGGGSVILRTYPIATLLGYKKFHFFGFDCSFPLNCEDQHVYKYDYYKEETFAVSVDNKKYYTTAGLMIQLKAFITYISLSEGEEFVVHGDSLTAAVCYRDVKLGRA